MNRTLAKKTAPKPSPKKPVVTKLPLQVQIRQELKKLGYDTDEDIYDEDISVELINSSNRDSFVTVSFELTPFAHCCGVLEAGNLCISEESGGYFEDLKRDEKKAVELAIALAFLEARENTLETEKPVFDKTAIAEARPIIFCSNGEDDCVIFEKVATKYLKGYYKQVSTTRNPNSGNVIKIYTSVY